MKSTLRRRISRNSLSEVARRATSRLVVPGARVLSLHGSQMVGDDVAVIVEAARPAEAAALMVQAYGLTRRQREVVSSRSELAAQKPGPASAAPG